MLVLSDAVLADRMEVIQNGIVDPFLSDLQCNSVGRLSTRVLSESLAAQGSTATLIVRADVVMGALSVLLVL